jgi:hypothetical protein
MVAAVAGNQHEGSQRELIGIKLGMILSKSRIPFFKVMPGQSNP